MCRRHVCLKSELDQNSVLYMATSFITKQSKTPDFKITELDIDIVLERLDFGNLVLFLILILKSEQEMAFQSHKTRLYFKKIFHFPNQKDQDFHEPKIRETTIEVIPIFFLTVHA